MDATLTRSGTTAAKVVTRFCIGLASLFCLSSTPAAWAVPAPQSIAFPAIADKALTDPPFAASATGGGSGNPVTFTSNTPAVCTATGANGATITPITTGFCSLAANQVGDGITFLTASTSTQAFFVKLAQTITFGALSTKVQDDPPFEVTATTSALGLNISPITFTSLTPIVCSADGVNGATVTPLTAGTCTIQANQASNATYAAAMPVNQSFTSTPVLKITASIVGAANGSIAPFGRIVVLINDKTEFTISPNPGYLAQVGGTCGGGFQPIGGVPPGGNGSVYITPKFTENCTVTFTFVAQRPVLTISGVPSVITPALSTPAPTTSAVNATATFAATLRGAVGIVDAALIGFFADGASISGCESKPVVPVAFDDLIGYQAACTTTALSIGERAITASFAGNASNFGANTDAAATPSQALRHTITAAPILVDTTPDAFSFVAQTGLALNALATSNVATVSGINAPAAISISGSGGFYSIGCTATITNAAATITNGQTVCVRLTASALNSTTTAAILSIGGVSATFSAATQAAVIVVDTTPDSFSFAAISNATPDALTVSNAITVSGINAASPISIAGNLGSMAAYSIGCTSTFDTIPGTIFNADRVCVRLNANQNDSAATSATLTIGSVSATFAVTTATVAPVKRFRVGIPSTLGHLFTTDENEYNVLTTRAPAAYVAEGVDHQIYRSAVTRDNQSTVPYYRVYLRGIRQHFWTTDANEYSALRADTVNVSDEGIDGHLFLRAGVAGTVPLYRMALAGTSIHHWTVDANEFQVLTTSRGWLPEGAAGNPVGVTGYVWPR